ncbi:MAG: alpha/beta hydrolase [Acidimicrobiia bacterium]|nr:alpha/beta hydrolase [Acidimicrobiia bacterium]
MTSAGNDPPFYWAHGEDDAPVLLCLHGIGSCGDAFVPQRPLALRCHRRVVAWDAPGYRHSPDPRADPGLDGWADAAAELIGRLGVARADVLGVSWGGVTATRLALRRPELVRSLVLADSSVGSGTDPAVAAAVRSRARDVTEHGIDEFARARAPKLVAANASADLVAEVAELMAVSVRMPPYSWAVDSLAATDHRSELGSIRCPTLIVVGADDIVTGPADAQELAAGIAGSELVTIADAGHLANQERPEAFNAATAAFLDRIETS